MFHFLRKTPTQYNHRRTRNMKCLAWNASIAQDEYRCSFSNLLLLKFFCFIISVNHLEAWYTLLYWKVGFIVESIFQRVSRCWKVRDEQRQEAHYSPMQQTEQHEPEQLFKARNILSHVRNKVLVILCLVSALALEGDTLLLFLLYFIFYCHINKHN